MGTFSFAGAASSEMSFILASAEITSIGGFCLGILIFLILIVIAGFLIMKYRRNDFIDDDDDEDRDIGVNKGIAKNKLDK